MSDAPKPYTRAEVDELAGLRHGVPLMYARLRATAEALEAAREALRGQVALTLDVQRERDELRASLSHETLMELRNALATATRERDHLRALFDSAGQGEHNVLALVEHWQREALDARRELDEARAWAGKCDDCERSAGIRVCTGCWEKSKEPLRAQVAHLREALADVIQSCQCQCSESWTSRGRHSPDCQEWVASDLPALLKETES